VGFFIERRDFLRCLLPLLYLRHFSFSRCRGVRAAVLRDDLIQRLLRSGFLSLLDLVVRDSKQRVG